MKKVVKVMCMAAVLVGLGTAAQAQLRQSVFLNGGLPTSDFAKDAAANALTSEGVPLMLTEIGKDATVGFGLGYRASYRFDVGVGMVAPFANVDFLYNSIAGKWSDKYNKERFSIPRYINIPLYAGVSYIYDELPWSDISAFGEFGIGSDLLWITREGGTKDIAGTTVNYKYAYSPSFAFAWMIGVGAFFGEHVSAGVYFYGMGKHNIDYTNATCDDHNIVKSSYSPDPRGVGSFLLRIGFHF